MYCTFVITFHRIKIQKKQAGIELDQARLKLELNSLCQPCLTSLPQVTQIYPPTYLPPIHWQFIHRIHKIFEVNGQILSLIFGQNVAFMVLKTIGRMSRFQCKNQFVKGTNKTFQIIFHFLRVGSHKLWLPTLNSIRWWNEDGCWVPGKKWIGIKKIIWMTFISWKNNI